MNIQNIASAASNKPNVKGHPPRLARSSGEAGGSGAGVKGFTLLELLIVITIIAVLSVTLIVAINPAETLRKARDTQRLSDLNATKTALAIYITSVSSPFLASASDSTACRTRTSGGVIEAWAGTDTIWYSLPSSSNIADPTLDGGSASVPIDGQVASTALGNVNAGGWIPVNLSNITGGSPISNLPIDPTNTVGALSVVDYDDLVYRYACDATNVGFEINAKLESIAFVTTDDKAGKDGGNNTTLYEIGTALDILGGTGAEF